MIRIVRWCLKKMIHASTRFIWVLAQSSKLVLQFGYLGVMLVAGFIAQLELMELVGALFGVLEQPSSQSVGLISLTAAWQATAWRFLTWYGFFVWFFYVIIPQNRSAAGQGHPHSRRQGRAAQWPQIGLRHALLWTLMWGPLALYQGLYDDMSSRVVGLVVIGLILAFYIHVWQGILLPLQRDNTDLHSNSWLRQSEHLRIS